MTLRTPGECPKCGGGFPGDVPDEQVCQCGSAWARQETRRRERRASKAVAPRSAMKRTPIARTAPAARASSPAKPRPKKKTDEIPPAVRAVVLERAGGLCECCGKTLEGYPTHCHHRERRNGRNHTPYNLVVLRSICHVIMPESVHQRPTWAKSRGLIVPTGMDPATTPLWLPSGKLVLLDPLEPVYLPAPGLKVAV